MGLVIEMGEKPLYATLTTTRNTPRPNYFNYPADTAANMAEGLITDKTRVPTKIMRLHFVIQDPRQY